jgi:ubiquinone biosynthesis monooxygenase Coq6
MALTPLHPGSMRTARRLLELPPAVRRNFWSTASASAAATSLERKPEIYDVVCVGGGPAGLSLVSALRSHPSTKDLKVALIDGQDLTTSRTPGNDAFSNRCSSLTPASVHFLKEIGAWNSVNDIRTQRYHGMEVWDGVSGSKISFDPVDQTSGGLLDSLADKVVGSRFSANRRRNETGELKAVATMCENGNLTAALLQQLKEGQAAELLDKTKVESIQYGKEPETEDAPDLSQWPVLTLPNGRQLAARLLVGADGANSPVRQFADIPSHGWDYGQHGVVATVNLDTSLPSTALRTAYQRFLPTGPIALLPLPDNKASIVWSTTPAHAAQLKQLSPEDFTAMANAAFRLLTTDIAFMLTHHSSLPPASELAWRESNTNSTALGLPALFPRIASTQESSVASFPLRMRHADTYTSHRVALIGDAAHTVHPLAGQGLNLGLADAESLAKQIAHGMEIGSDIGSCWCLDGYNSDRWAKNNAMLGVVDKLQKIYSAGSGPVVWGRSLGLGLVDRMGPLKGLLMGAAAGVK